MPLTPQDFVAKSMRISSLNNACSTWLDLAHKKLDSAVLKAYGWSEGLSDDEILERLLKLNLERAGR